MFNRETMENPTQDIENQDEFEDVENPEENETEEKKEDIKPKEDFLEEINDIVKEIEAVDLELTNSLEAYKAVKEDKDFPQEAERAFEKLSSPAKTYASLGPDLFGKEERGGSYGEVKRQSPPRTMLMAQDPPISAGRYARPEGDLYENKYLRSREEPLKASLNKDYSAGREEPGPSPGRLIGTYKYTTPTTYSYEQTKKYTPGMGQPYYGRKFA